MTLTDCLLNLARMWAAAHDKSLARLGQLVAKDGKFFSRVESGKGVQIATWERFLAFFRDPGNWPGGHIPGAAGDLLNQVQAIAVDAPAPDMVVATAGEATGAGQSVHGPGDSPRESCGSATKSPDIIRGAESAADNMAENIRDDGEVIESEGEADSRGPFSVSPPTCSPTRVPSAPSANPACSTSGAEAA